MAIVTGVLEARTRADRRRARQPVAGEQRPGARPLSDSNWRDLSSPSDIAGSMVAELSSGDVAELHRCDRLGATGGRMGLSLCQRRGPGGYRPGPRWLRQAPRPLTCTPRLISTSTSTMPIFSVAHHDRLYCALDGVAAAVLALPSRAWGPPFGLLDDVERRPPRAARRAEGSQARQRGEARRSAYRRYLPTSIGDREGGGGAVGRRLGPPRYRNDIRSE